MGNIGLSVDSIRYAPVTTDTHPSKGETGEEGKREEEGRGEERGRE